MLAADFTEMGEAAARRAAAIAEKFDAKLTFLHVIDYFPEDIPNHWIAPEDQDPQAYLARCAQQALAELAEKIGARAQLEVLFTDHSAASGIVIFGREHEVDLIVLACHGHRGISALLSSTVERVSRHAPGDVLVVHPST